MKICYILLDKDITFASLSRYIGLLPAQRQEKIQRYRFEADKLRSLVAGLLIRHTIGDVPIRYGEHGKPYANGICFSVTHSGNAVAVAVDDHELGIDAEMIADESRLKIADRFFAPNERAYVNEAEDKALAFTRIWTRKEAYLKCTGEGIATDLSAFDTVSEPLDGRIVTYDMDGFCLSVCSEQAIGEKGIYISELELKYLIE